MQHQGLGYTKTHLVFIQNSNLIGFFVRDRKEDTGIKGKGHVETKEDPRMMQPWEHTEPPEAGRGKEGWSPRDLRGSMAWPTY